MTNNLSNSEGFSGWIGVATDTNRRGLTDQDLKVLENEALCAFCNDPEWHSAKYHRTALLTGEYKTFKSDSGLLTNAFKAK
jgi:hypothetical protein|tara:strand:+ start:235 stop:477 length:243 start_codon:yes stop_codon:yes gene_type:complete